MFLAIKNRSLYTLIVQFMGYRSIIDLPKKHLDFIRYYAIINLLINKNLQERINIAPLVDLKERGNSDELYKKWKISNA